MIFLFPRWDMYPSPGGYIFECVLFLLSCKFCRGCRVESFWVGRLVFSMSWTHLKLSQKNDFHHFWPTKNGWKPRTMVETNSICCFGFSSGLFVLPPSNWNLCICASQIGSSLQGSGRNQHLVLLLELCWVVPRNPGCCDQKHHNQNIIKTLGPVIPWYHLNTSLRISRDLKSLVGTGDQKKKTAKKTPPKPIQNTISGGI